MIHLEGVVKEFGGALDRARQRRVRALDGVSLAVAPGTALGIAGPNGAGKSTLLRLLLGYIRPTRGSVTVGGLAPRAYVERHGIGYVSELIALHPGWTVRGTLQAFAALGEVRDERARIAHVLDELGIAELAGRRVATLSKGNLQRLALAQALLAPRRLMILDEPTHGLDPEWTARLRDLVAAWRAEDPERVLVIASHNLDELERTVERVAVLRAGRVCAQLEAAGSGRMRLEVAPAGAAAVRAAFPGAAPQQGAPGVFHLPAGEEREMSERLGRLIAQGVVVRSFASETVRLEDRVRAALLVDAGGAA